MRVRRRGLVAGGFEAFELPPQRGTPPVDPFEDFRLNQTGRQPRRVILESVPRRQDGPIVTEAGFDRNRVVGMLDLATSQIGRSVQFGGVGNTGTSQPLIQAQASDQRARQLTINLSVIEVNSTNRLRDFVAVVSWGSGGMIIPDVEVDFIGGCTFSLICSYLRIIVRNDSVAAPTPGFTVGAFFGYEPRPGLVRGPQRTIKTGVVALAASTTIEVPRFATSFSIVRQPLTTAITLTMLGGTGATIGIIPIAAGADVSNNIYPIPNDVVDIQVTPAAVQLEDARLIFGLSL